MTFRGRARLGFILFETMLAVAIFVLAVLGLGKCVHNCLRAEMLMEEDGLAQRALENRMAEIEAGAVSVTGPKTEAIEGSLPGLKIRQSRQALEFTNEKKEPVDGLFQITLQLTWGPGDEDHQRALTFFLAPSPTGQALRKPGAGS